MLDRKLIILCDSRRKMVLWAGAALSPAWPVSCLVWRMRHRGVKVDALLAGALQKTRPAAGLRAAGRVGAEESETPAPLQRFGRVAEWFKAAVLKTAVGASPPWVRIPPLPPTWSATYLILNSF